MQLSRTNAAQRLTVRGTFRAVPASAGSIVPVQAAQRFSSLHTSHPDTTVLRRPNHQRHPLDPHRRIHFAARSLTRPVSCRHRVDSAAAASISSPARTTAPSRSTSTAKSRAHLHTTSAYRAAAERHPPPHHSLLTTRSPPVDARIPCLDRPTPLPPSAQPSSPTRHLHPSAP